jgi:trk system potassium uptake protein TrkA
MLIGAIVRDDVVEIPTGASRVEPGDSVIAMVTYKALRAAESVLGGGSRPAS